MKQRVRENGHPVPEEKIRSRYERSVRLLPKMINPADEAFVYDNSIQNATPMLTFAKLETQYILINRDIMRPNPYEWVQQHIVLPLEREEKTVWFRTHRFPASS